ncbi:CocE/NonD family hydrolase [Patulibacter sp.]|uniref:CocE/NonD family hydrolase n=1 Tax=Patulibacter sp. TaxID=1912859 RepID=UPI0027175C8B|nr:CocE/NonD family hydrolase [Patulibacter sp.]MDO9410015.1 CocE/NonD family hydrolase [Patulibacter sp.]
MGVLLGLLATVPASGAATVEEAHRVGMSDGVTLRATVKGEAPLTRRPTIVEFTPYGRFGGTGADVPGFNRLTVEIRGTGDSDGVFDALGPRTQQDVEETLRWACGQPWSDGKLGLYGFSASAITVYNSLHRRLPCVGAAVLGSGTHELYRDLLVPGGISNLVPGAGVIAGIGIPALAQGLDRLLRNPLSAVTTIVGLAGAGITELTRPHLDDWWRERGMRGNANAFPILMLDGFFDVESRGAFQAFQELRGTGARLVVGGGHDQPPAGTDAGRAQRADWYRHFLRGQDNGVERRPKVELLLADGDRQAYVGGRFVRHDATDWPVPGTRWSTLRLDAAPSGSGPLIGDGSLGLGAPRRTGSQAYAALPSILTATDPPNAAVLGGVGDAVTGALPVLRDMNLHEQLGRSYTTPPLREDVLAAGPAALKVRLGTSSPGSGIWAVISDVSPDGVAHAMAAGRLNTNYPEVDPDRSLRDPRTGTVVQPYGRFDRPSPATQGRERDYQVEFWPIGNRFRAGHRIRLTVVGASLGSPLSPPGIHTLDVGASSLQFPALPGSDLSHALGGPRTPADAAPGAGAASARPRIRVQASPRRLRVGRSVRLRVRVRSTTTACRGRVRVRVLGRRVRTDRRGRASLRVRPRRAGRASVVVGATGCRTGRATLRVRR